MLCVGEAMKASFTLLLQECEFYHQYIAALLFRVTVDGWYSILPTSSFYKN